VGGRGVDQEKYNEKMKRFFSTREKEINISKMMRKKKAPNTRTKKSINKTSYYIENTYKRKGNQDGKMEGEENIYMYKVTLLFFPYVDEGREK
jgi:hypothetical protein